MGLEEKSDFTEMHYSFQALEVAVTLSDVRPVERGFFTACGGTSASFLDERCRLQK